VRARVVAATLGAALALAVLPAASAGASAGETDRALLAQVRQATVQFHDLQAATDAGYQQFLPCFDDGAASGMGQHFAMLPIDDAVIDALHPEVLVYEPHNGRYQLVAVEYVIPQALWTSEDEPMLFGEHFHTNDTLGIWALHAWIWRGNPGGVHDDFSPNVRMCPTAS
jgi:hypothetical protein